MRSGKLLSSESMSLDNNTYGTLENVREKGRERVRRWVRKRVRGCVRKGGERVEEGVRDA